MNITDITAVYTRANATIPGLLTRAHDIFKIKYLQKYVSEDAITPPLSVYEMVLSGFDSEPDDLRPDEIFIDDAFHLGGMMLDLEFMRDCVAGHRDNKIGIDASIYFESLLEVAKAVSQAEENPEKAVGDRLVVEKDLCSAISLAAAMQKKQDPDSSAQRTLSSNVLECLALLYVTRAGHISEEIEQKEKNQRILDKMDDRLMSRVQEERQNRREKSLSLAPPSLESPPTQAPAPQPSTADGAARKSEPPGPAIT